MNDEQLKDLWASQSSQSLPGDADKVIKTLRDNHRCEERRILWLNVQECIPAFLLFLFFSAIGFFDSSGRWAFFTAALLCLGIGLFLVGSTIRQRQRESAFGESIKEQLRRSISQAQHRQWLYENILVWYLLPGVLAWFAIVYEKMLKHGVSTFAAIYVGLSFAFFGWVYWLNRRVGRNRYRPHREQLTDLLRCIESETDDVSEG